jgi:hypothetical protein
VRGGVARRGWRIARARGCGGAREGTHSRRRRMVSTRDALSRARARVRGRIKTQRRSQRERGDEA